MQAGHAPNEPSLDAQRIAFGRRLRALRQDRGWTLSKLAQRSGLAISTISKAERGRMALTYDRMLQLAAGMDLDMAEFFAEDGTSFAPGSFSVARRGCFRRQETPNYVYEMLFPDMRNKAMTPMTGTLKARDVMAFDEFVRHRGEEFERMASLHRELQKVADRYDWTVTQLAIAWVLSHPAVTFAIVGASTPSQAEHNMAVSGRRLSGDEVEECEALVREHRGPR